MKLYIDQNSILSLRYSKLVILFVLTTYLSIAQDVTYHAKYLYGQQVKNGQKFPLGKKIAIKYDSFFKIYSVTYINSSGRLEKKDFVISVREIGDIFYKNVFNYIKLKKALIIESENSLFKYYLFEDVIIY